MSRNERCLYVCGEQTPDEFRAALQAAGIDVAREEARGALVLLTKETHDLEGVPAIAVTAYAGPPDRAEALAVGFQQHLPKPIDPGGLVQAIYDLTHRST